MKARLAKVQSDFSEGLREISTKEALRALDTKFLGKKGKLTVLLRELKGLPLSERQKIGREANELKRKIRDELDRHLAQLKTPGGTSRSLDITLPGEPPLLGRFHPITRIIEEIERVFCNLGFTVVEGPEVETEYYNFDALGMHKDHPARDEQDSFYISKGVLLRTQTSPVQIRIMEKQKPPIRIISSGRCFRRDATDASHSSMFYQVEGLLVDTDVSFGDLKGSLKVFVEQLFGEDTRMRFRPDFFPFTEPSAEVSISCLICKGKGCPACSKSGWLELGGAGMVDPEVFQMVGYDSEKYSGFAFGMGIERVAMLKYGIKDIRLFLENDMRFLEQF